MMRRVALMVLLTVLSAAWSLSGCRSRSAELGVPPDAGQLLPGSWESLAPEPTRDRRTRPHWIPADRAALSPSLRVTTLSGEQLEVRPGKPGKVTLVVFWGMDLPVMRAAARYVSDLRKQYAEMGAEAVGFVERTRSHKHAAEFLLNQRIDYPCYRDDFSALEKMGDAAGVDAGKAIPSFFLVDDRMRVRLFKRGFSFSGALKTYEDRWLGREQQVQENAAPGEAVEDFLRRLLRERAERSAP